LKVDYFKQRLSHLERFGQFQGFTPRWNLPVKVRNPNDPGKNSSCLLVILDSSREADLQIAKHFSQDVIGESDIMVSQQILDYLDIKAEKKEKIEMYFDILSMMKNFGLLDMSKTNSQQFDDFDSRLDAEFQTVLKEMLPTLRQIASILETDLGLEVDDDYVVSINPI